MFLNYKNGQLSLNTYRFPDCLTASLKDVIDCQKHFLLPEHVFNDNLVANVKRLHLFNAQYDLDVLVDYDAELDDKFLAYDIDNKEVIHVNGWLFDFEDV